MGRSSIRRSRVPRPVAVCVKTASGVNDAAISFESNAKSAPTRSSLLINRIAGILRSFNFSKMTRVWDCTPSRADSTRITPSNTVRDRSTSAMNSIWPGVSMRLIFTPSQVKETVEARMVMPRCRSKVMASVVVVPLSTRPISRLTPLWYSSASVTVVFPASTCAKMPILIGIKIILPQKVVRPFRPFGRIKQKAAVHAAALSYDQVNVEANDVTPGTDGKIVCNFSSGHVACRSPPSVCFHA